MYLIDFLALLYFTARAAAQDHNVTVIIPSAVPTVYEPPAASLQLLSSWTNVFSTERVQLICNITGVTDWTITWHRNGHVQGPDVSVSFSADGSVLTIASAALTHAGSYVCKGLHKTKGVATENSNSLEINVHENKPKPSVSRRPDFNRMFVRESVTFTCAVNMGSSWEYKWFHNGAEVQAANTGTYTIVSIGLSNSGRYTCRAKRGSFETDESETAPLQVSDPPTPSLKLLSPWLKVFKGERVELFCDVPGSDWTYTWYKQQKLQLEVNRPSLNITEITNDNAGEYACKVHLESRNVTSRFSIAQTVVVYDNTPKSTVSRVPGFNTMYVGECVNLTCSVDIVSPGWSYQWYKDGRMLTSATDKTLSLRLHLTDGDNYSCGATRGRTTWTGLSPKTTLEVRRIPVPWMMNTTQWLDVFPMERVVLSCGMMDGSSGWTYTWYKDGQKVQADSNVSLSSDGSTLSIKSASALRTGQYECKGHLLDRSVHSNVSAGQTLRVYDEIPTATLTQDPGYAVMYSGESVSFSCQINVSSGWEYIYYKDGNRQLNSGVSFTVESVQKVNGGSYKCRAKRGRNSEFYSHFSSDIKLSVKEIKPNPLMTQEPSADRVYVGESVSFVCKVGIPSGWEFLWYKDGAALPYNSSSRFTVHYATSSHDGVYQCQAKRDKSAFHTEQSDTQRLQVSEIPVPVVKNASQWLDVFPTESVTLSCGMTDGSADWTYTWYRDGQKVQTDAVVSLDSDGSTLSIRSALAEHAGQYSCSGTLKIRPVHSKTSTALTLSVYETKPRVTLMRTPEYDVMHTEDAVSFSCHVNVSSGWHFLWYHDNRPLPKSGNTHDIASVETRNSGSYSCRVQRGASAVFQSDHSRAVRLNVEERPQANVALLTGWSEVFSTDILVLRCEVRGREDSWNYTWSREGQQSNLSCSATHMVTPANDPQQSVYTCQGVRAGRPSYSQHSAPFKTKNLLLKRRILLSISGCLFFGLIFVFLGCIVLRFTRKSVDDDEKPEEENLFLTMAQLKDRADAPNPLAEYLTDDALNALSKDAEEKGKISSESTPLPITTQEEQAVTPESKETDGNNGLVSFKQ